MHAGGRLTAGTCYSLRVVHNLHNLLQAKGTRFWPAVQATVTAVSEEQQKEQKEDALFWDFYKSSHLIDFEVSDRLCMHLCEG